MPRLLHTLLLPALLLSLSGCGLVSKALHAHPKKEEPDKEPKDLYIGTIDMVNPEQHFVLIKTGIQLKLQSGWKLETRPVNGGPKAVLIITPEQKQNFLSADISEGYPQQGEMVVLPPQAGMANAVPTLSAASGAGDASPQPAAAKPAREPIRAPNGDLLPPPIP